MKRIILSLGILSFLLVSGCLSLASERTYAYTDPHSHFVYKLVLSGDQTFILYASDGTYSGKYIEDSTTVTILPNYFPGRQFQKSGSNLTLLNGHGEMMVLQ
jgi:hypothetical protein